MTVFCCSCCGFRSVVIRILFSFSLIVLVRHMSIVSGSGRRVRFSSCSADLAATTDRRRRGISPQFFERKPLWIKSLKQQTTNPNGFFTNWDSEIKIQTGGEMAGEFQVDHKKNMTTYYKMKVQTTPIHPPRVCRGVMELKKKIVYTPPHLRHFNNAVMFR